MESDSIKEDQGQTVEGYSKPLSEMFKHQKIHLFFFLSVTSGGQGTDGTNG